MENLRQSIENQTTASLTLSKSVTQTHSPDSNLVFSPLSINVVLSLIAAGSSAQTLDQILSFLVSDSASSLHSLSSQLVSIVLSDGSPVGGPMISFANGVWVDRSLSVKEGFEKVVVGGYKAVLDSVDFQNKVVCGDYNAVLDSFDFQNKAVEVTNQVNLWAEKETNGLIKEVLPSGSVDGSTRLIFANSLYFKGAWNEKFDSSKTKDYDFHLLDGSSVQVPFMTSKKKQLVSEFEGFKVLALPYKQGEDKRRFTMYFFLPDTKDGLPSLKDRIFSESDFLNRHLPYQAVEVGDFRIPRFKFGFGFEVSNTLKGLGLVLPFSGGGLTEMVNSPMGKDLYVSNVFHKSFIEVNEEGTEAVAVSAAVVNLRCLMVADKIDFVADHPFLFVIREDMTGVVLFVGQLLNPLKN